jgi:type VI secretion system secreted protein VgrG
LVSPTILDPYKLIDSKADIIFERFVKDGSEGKEERRIHGVIRHLRDRLVGSGAGDTGTPWANEYILQIVPPLWTASLTVTNDVYQKLNVPKIVAQILDKQLGMKAGQDFEIKVSDGDYPEKEFIVEHNESHLNFISRLCEHVGIFFFFDGKKVVFGDKNEHFAKANPEKAQFRGRGEHSHVFELEAVFRHVPAGFRVRDYNYRSPHVEVAADHTLSSGQLGHVNEFGPHVADPAEAKRIAKVRAEAAGSDFQTFEGRSEYAGFAAGSITELEGHHAEEAVKGPLLITEVSHHCVQPVFGRGDSMQQHYENEFRAMPAKNTFRPARLARKPVVPGLVTAMVETEAEEKLGAIDDEGCYRLNFHYDGRSNEAEGKRKPGGASRPVRMAQPSAGADRKFHLPLKSGTEVVVGCVNGDPDRPIILGAVPDKGARSGKGWRDSPVTADNKEKLILKTNETELSIDDTEGKPRWRTQVADWQHVQLIGEPELGKNAKVAVPEKGYALASENNYTATVNEGMTLESTTYTALQAMSTVLTKTKHLDYTGEDPGFEDWKKVEEALAKAVEFTRHLVDMLAETKKVQEERAKGRTEEKKKAHQKAQAKAAEKGKPEEGDLDKDPPECEECKKKEQELEEARKKKKQAANDAIMAERKKNDAAAKSAVASGKAKSAGGDQAARKAEADAAKQDLDAANQEETQAKEAYKQASEEAKQKAAEAEAAAQKCREARAKQNTEREKKKHQEAEQRAAEQAKAAEAHEDEVRKFWKRIDSELKEGKATEVKDLEKVEKPKDAENKDLWSKIAIGQVAQDALGRYREQAERRCRIAQGLHRAQEGRRWRVQGALRDQLYQAFDRSARGRQHVPLRRQAPHAALAEDRPPGQR